VEDSSLMQLCTNAPAASMTK